MKGKSLKSCVFDDGTFCRSALRFICDESFDSYSVIERLCLRMAMMLAAEGLFGSLNPCICDITDQLIL
jgi:hypothetical protein